MIKGYFMLKTLLIASLLATLPLVADTSLGKEISKGESSHKIKRLKK